MGYARFVGFLSEAQSVEAAKSVAAEMGFGEEHIYNGTIEMAIAHLGANPSPEYLLVEVSSAETARQQLDRLADVCSPTVKVIVASAINEYSFFAWLMEVGVHAYMLEPFTPEQLKKALEKEKATPVQTEQKQPGALTAFMGTRGGVGTTTILSNLAYLIDKEYTKSVGVLDMDIHFGTVGMVFDLEPVRGLNVLFEQPDRVDSLFLDRVTARFGDRLSLMSAEEPLKNAIQASASAAEVLERTGREKYQQVFVDLPRTLSPLSRHFLEHADKVVLVTELNLLGLRDLIRLTDYLKELRKEPIVVANREGLASKHEIAKKEFEKHYGHPIHIHIPCMMEAFAASASGEMLLETTKNSAALSAMHRLAETITGEEISQDEALEKKRMGWLHKGKA